MPAIQGARAVARQAVCSSNSRQYGAAAILYGADYQNFFPWYAKAYNPNWCSACTPIPELTRSVYYNTLAPYVGGETLSEHEPVADQLAKDQINFRLEIRMCPTGEAMVGPNYGGINYNWASTPRVLPPAPWVYGGDESLATPVYYPQIRINHMTDPAGWIMMLDVQDWGMYSMAAWKPNIDWDGDGVDDTHIGTGMLYNFGKPRVHRDSSNVVLVDGHVDSMTFEDFVSPDFDLWRN
jgi:hypothetical protein